MSYNSNMILLCIGIFFIVGLIICLIQINDMCNKENNDPDCNSRIGSEAIFFIGTPSGVFLSAGIGLILRDKKRIKNQI